MEARGNKAWQPEHRDRIVSKALQACAAMASSADKGAVRDLSLIGVKQQKKIPAFAGMTMLG
jgi:dihydroxy-acid dehydratase